MRARVLLDIIVCVYVYIIVLICIIISLYGGSHASDILHVSVAKPIIYNIVLLLCTRVVSQLPIATAPPAATIACVTVWTTFRTLSYYNGLTRRPASHSGGGNLRVV